MASGNARAWRRTRRGRLARSVHQQVRAERQYLAEARQMFGPYHVASVQVDGQEVAYSYHGSGSAEVQEAVAELVAAAYRQYAPGHTCSQGEG